MASFYVDAGKYYESLFLFQQEVSRPEWNIAIGEHDNTLPVCDSRLDLLCNVPVICQHVRHALSSRSQQGLEANIPTSNGIYHSRLCEGATNNLHRNH